MKSVLSLPICFGATNLHGTKTHYRQTTWRLTGNLNVWNHITITGILLPVSFAPVALFHSRECVFLKRRKCKRLPSLPAYMCRDQRSAGLAPCQRWNTISSVRYESKGCQTLVVSLQTFNHCQDFRKHSLHNYLIACKHDMAIKIVKVPNAWKKDIPK